MAKNILSFTMVMALLLSNACQQPTASTGPKIDFQKFELDNGLEVIFHEDHSDPVTAVALTFHVGSAREKTGRTGFAHLFEHLLFLESENLGKGGLDKMSSRIGGSGANGSTSRDRTNYFQTVPKDALEKMIWAEADKLGYFINTVTEPVLAKEKQVVKNEKRQRVDNAPYGHSSYVTGKNLYPDGHPYNWQVIGSLEDLQNATVDDVKEFYRRWYVPNNATLVVAGDFDPAEAKAWVEKYFAEIPRGQEIAPMEKRPVSIAQNKYLYYEDNFARVPQLGMTWAGVHRYHPDSYALDVLSSLLADGKTSAFYKTHVEKYKLCANANIYSQNSELAGEISLLVRAYPGIDLDSVKMANSEAFALFENDSFSDADLARVKAGLETNFYFGLSSVLSKAFQLAQYNIFAGDPGYLQKDIEKQLAVSREDVMRVYNQYIKGQNYIATSFVPRGQAELMIEGSTLAEVVEEKIVAGAEEEFVLTDEIEYERSASSFDRSIEPSYGPTPSLTPPSVWQGQTTNGLKLYGIENNELPLVNFNLRLKGGLLLDDPAKVGVANLLANTLDKGTQSKTPAELEAAIEQLGAYIQINANSESIEISGSTLKRNFKATMALVEEILLEPRWDTAEFSLAKQNTLSRLVQQESQPSSIAGREYYRLIYGEDNILSKNIEGYYESVSNINLTDLQAYYNQYFSPTAADLLIVGAVKQNAVNQAITKIGKDWEAKTVEIPSYPMPAPITASKIYFYDVPGAKQSEIRYGYLAVSADAPDFYPLQVMNYRLGGGSFASQLTQELREGKGYTYGIRSNFRGTSIPGPFTISSGIRSNATYDATALVQSILRQYGPTFSEADLETTKSFLLKSNARAFETLNAKEGILANIADYAWSPDYVLQRQEIVKGMTVERIQELASKYIRPDQMIYLIVGDAETQLDALEGLGYGKAVLLNP
ncbi:MAG: M16 family metallopeptidase [Bacteroidia bacterium]